MPSWPAFLPRKPAVTMLVTDLASMRKLRVMLRGLFPKFLDASNPAGNWSTFPAEYSWKARVTLEML